MKAETETHTETGSALQRWAGVAAVLHGIAFVAGPVTLSLVLAAIGLHPGDLDDPAKALPAVLRAYGGFAVSGLMYMLVGVTVLVMALFFEQRLRDGAPSLARAATASGLIATALFGVAGVLDVTALVQVALHYSVNANQAGGAYLAVQAVTDGLLSAASLAYGAWLVMAFWAAIRVQAFTRSLSYVGFIWGILALLSPFISSNLASVELLGPIWAIWLGIVLLGSSRSGAPAASTASYPGRTNGRLPLSPELPESSEV